MILSRRSTACWKRYDASAISRLRVALFDRLDHAAHAVDRLRSSPGAPFSMSQRQPLDEVRAAERIDHVGDAALVRDDLLRAQGQRRRLGGRQRQRLVERIRVQRVGAAEHRGERLQAVRTTLLYGCCAVSETPAVWVWKRSFHDRSSFAPKRSRITSAQISPGGAELGDLLEEVAVRVEEERDARRELVDVEPGVDAVLHVLDAVAQRERQFLQRRRARLADVIPADRDRVPPRHFLRAEREDVGDQPHRLARRVDVFLLRDELLEDVVLDRARQLSSSRPPASRRPPGTSRRSSTPAS